MKSKFVDTHNHAIWGMDDGVANEEEALQLLQSAQRSHVGIIFVTPHFIPKGLFEPSTAEIREGAKNLRQLAKKHQIDVEIKSGCEFRIGPDSFEAIVKGLYTPFEDTDYVLIEFTRSNAKSREAMDAIDELIVQGMTPIIAHPERYFEDIGESREFVQRFRNRGCVISVNRTSLLNTKRSAYKVAWDLIDQGLAHIVATDAHHGEGTRMCLLDDIYELITTKYDQNVADMLFVTNPWHIVNNEPVETVKITKKKWRLFK